MQILDVVVDGDPPAPEFALKIQLGAARDLRGPPQRDPPFGEQSHREVNERLRFGQLQAPQRFIPDFDQHGVTVAAPGNIGKLGSRDAGDE